MNSTRMNELTIDASTGGGQVLRTSLALSGILQRPIRLLNIRQQRLTQGLRSVHVAAIDVARSITRAVVEGNSRGSMTVSFQPRGVSDGDFHVDATRWGGSGVGSASNLAILVLPLLAAGNGHSRVTITGATHIPGESCVEFLNHVILPALLRLGMRASLKIHRRGYTAPGVVELRVAPLRRPLRPLEVLTRGRLRSLEILVAGPPRVLEIISAVELRSRVAGGLRSLPRVDVRCAQMPESEPALAFATGWLRFARTRLGWCFSIDAENADPHDAIAERLEEAVGRCLPSTATLDPFAADSILPWLVLASGTSRFSVDAVTSHLRSQCRLLGRWFGDGVVVDDGNNGHRTFTTYGRGTSFGDSRFPLGPRALILHGGPGAGKSRVSRALCVLTKASRIAVGEKLREYERPGGQDPFRASLGRLLRAGDDVPDGLVRRIVKRRLERSDPESGLLLDGFPRSVSQARWILDVLTTRGFRETLVVELEKPELHDSEQRPERARADDRSAVRQRRWAGFRRQWRELMAYYASRGIPVQRIDADRASKLAIVERVAVALGVPGPRDLPAMIRTALLVRLRDPTLSFEERESIHRLAAELNAREYCE